MIINTTGSKGGGTSPTINPLSVTENGTYTAPSGVDGYSPVTVNVSGGGGSSQEDAIIEGTISGTYVNSTATRVRTSAFMGCSGLVSVSFKEASEIGRYAFSGCKSLTTASFEKATFINDWAFASLSALTTINFPALISTSGSVFANCKNLAAISMPNLASAGRSMFASCTFESISLPKLSNIGFGVFYDCVNLSELRFSELQAINNVAFRGCVKLVSLNLTQNSYCVTLGHSNAFASTPIDGYSAVAGQYGSIYVPASLYESYQTDTNWNYYSSRMVSV